MTRDEFVRLQKEVYFDQLRLLTVGEEAACARFEALALDTFDALAKTPRFWLCLSPYPESGLNFLHQAQYLSKQQPDVVIPPGLVQRWEDWNREYYELRGRNPRLEIRDLMHTISESHDASSWPCGYEHRIQEWADNDDPATPPPFDDLNRIATPEFRRQLRQARERAGGWLFDDPEAGNIRFVPEAEWQQIRAARVKAEADIKRAREAAAGRLLRAQTRLREIAAIARADTTFCEAFRAWMGPHPHRAVPQGGSVVVLTGASSPRGPTIQELTPQAMQAAIQHSLPDFLLQFAERVRQPGDEVTALEIMLFLLSELR
jgi:hypothetical protein